MFPFHAGINSRKRLTAAQMPCKSSRSFQKTERTSTLPSLHSALLGSSVKESTHPSNAKIQTMSRTAQASSVTQPRKRCQVETVRNPQPVILLRRWPKHQRLASSHARNVRLNRSLRRRSDRRRKKCDSRSYQSEARSGSEPSQNTPLWDDKVGTAKEGDCCMQ